MPRERPGSGRKVLRCERSEWPEKFSRRRPSAAPPVALPRAGAGLASEGQKEIRLKSVGTGVSRFRSGDTDATAVTSSPPRSEAALGGDTYWTILCWGDNNLVLVASWVHAGHLLIIGSSYSRGVSSEFPEGGVDTAALRVLLHCALVCGQPPRSGVGVGPATQAALIAVARHQPDATAEHIIAVYDAHRLEQHRLAATPDRRHHGGDERSAQAADYAAMDTLITQLAITYPGVPRGTIATIVTELRTTLADPRLRELDLLRIEYEADQRLSRAQ